MEITLQTIVLCATSTPLTSNHCGLNRGVRSKFGPIMGVYKVNPENLRKQYSDSQKY